jgi:hypothetical protein
MLQFIRGGKVKHGEVLALKHHRLDRMLFMQQTCAWASIIGQDLQDEQDGNIVSLRVKLATLFLKENVQTEQVSIQIKAISPK